MEASIEIRELTDEFSMRLSHGAARFLVRSWRGETLPLRPSGTHFGFLMSGPGALTAGSTTFPLLAHSYFSMPGSARLTGRQAHGILISQFDYRGLFHLGGPIEETGRLKYIDGCSDTLLVPPVLKGDACLNLLCLPPKTRQTAHTHPSFRVGIVVSGRGECCMGDGRVLAMTPNSVFSLAANCVHSFRTYAEPMNVVAFHPESDFGPSDDNHPMINRTLINGVCAAGMPDVRSRVHRRDQGKMADS